MTLKQLLTLAKSLAVVGRHDMSKAQLEAAVAAAQPAPVVEAQPATAPADAYKPSKPSSHGGRPWQPKLYYVDRATFDVVVADGTLAKAPTQVQLILKSMVADETTTWAKARRGVAVTEAAIQAKRLNTKCDPAALFAYYRRDMEKLGLVLAN